MARTGCRARYGREGGAADDTVPSGTEQLHQRYQYGMLIPSKAPRQVSYPYMDGGAGTGVTAG